VWKKNPDEAALRDELRARLAHYKIPRRWFSLDAIPLTANNKLDRMRALSLATKALP
jgi:acyl-CoA synthetase (AMP-forming)/AMP-acid ligase II